MTTATFLIIMFAAILHASWNALVKGGSDKRLQMTAIALGHLPFAPLAIYWSPALDFACLPNLILGAVFHFGYHYYLVESYKKGDLSQVYPIARASAPLIVTLISVFILDVTLGFYELIAIALIASGLLASSGLHNQKIASVAVKSALITGCFIAAYSMTDGYGGRIGGSPVAFYGWLAIINGLVWLAYILIVSPTSIPKMFGSAKWVFVGGGFASFLAYASIMYAFSKAPIAIVMALRETSIIFALLLGIFFLKEKITYSKLIGTALTVFGIIILRLQILV